MTKGHLMIKGRIITLVLLGLAFSCTTPAQGWWMMQYQLGVVVMEEIADVDTSSYNVYEEENEYALVSTSEVAEETVTSTLQVDTTTTTQGDSNTTLSDSYTSTVLVEDSPSAVTPEPAPVEPAPVVQPEPLPIAPPVVESVSPGLNGHRSANIRIPTIENLDHSTTSVQLVVRDKNGSTTAIGLNGDEGIVTVQWLSPTESYEIKVVFRDLTTGRETVVPGERLP